MHFTITDNNLASIVTWKYQKIKQLRQNDTIIEMVVGQTRKFHPNTRMIFSGARAAAEISAGAGHGRGAGRRRAPAGRRARPGPCAGPSFRPSLG